MTWPPPPQPWDGVVAAMVAVVATLLLVWIVSPLFNSIMRVLQ